MSRPFEARSCGECSCGTPGLTYDGPRVDCDVHGLPSAAFEAGRREGAQDERDAQRIRGDLCRWCHRERGPGEQHGVVVAVHHEGTEPEIGCESDDGKPLPFGYPVPEVPF